VINRKRLGAISESKLLRDFPRSVSWRTALADPEAVAPTKAVYLIRTTTRFARLRGESSVLYIGSTIRLGGTGDRARLYAYRYSRGNQPRRIRMALEALAADGRKVELRWQAKKTEVAARATETKLLTRYLHGHLEYPPLNRRG
jgi:hypothetical protein